MLRRGYSTNLEGARNGLIHSFEWLGKAYLPASILSDIKQCDDMDSIWNYIIRTIEKMNSRVWSQCIASLISELDYH